MPLLFKNLDGMTWNYSASGHGKGPMDGVGGAVKRNADRLVLQGLDISSAKSFVEKMKDSKVDIWEVPGSEIDKMKTQLPSKIVGIPEIMNVHQITWSRQSWSYVFLRTASCFDCPLGQACKHFPMKKAKINLLPVTNRILFQFR